MDKIELTEQAHNKQKNRQPAPAPTSKESNFCCNPRNYGHKTSRIAAEPVQKNFPGTARANRSQGNGYRNRCSSKLTIYDNVTYNFEDKNLA